MGVPSAAAGATWSTPVAVSAPARSPMAPDVAVTTRGTVLAVWRRELSRQLRYAIERAVAPAGRPFGRATQLSVTEGAGDEGPRVVAGTGGAALIAWSRRTRSADSFRIETMRLLPPGTRWGRVMSATAPGPDATAPRLALDRVGTAVAVWQEPGVVRAALSGGSGPWNGSTMLSRPDEFGQDVHVTISPSGWSVAVWTATPGTRRVVQASVREPGGDWTAPLVISSPGAQSAEGARVAAGNGRSMAAWRETGEDGAVRLVSAERLADGRWTTPVTIASGGRLVAGEAPLLALDSRGGATAVWRRDGGAGIRVETASNPNARTRWIGRRALSPAGSAPGRPDLEVSPSGRAAVVWARAGAVEGAVRSGARRAWARAERVPGSAAGRPTSPNVGVPDTGRIAVAWSASTPRGSVVRVAQRED